MRFEPRSLNHLTMVSVVVTIVTIVSQFVFV